MQRRSPRGFLIGIALALVASACSGGDSTGDYFRGLETASSALNSELDDLEGGFNAGLLDIDFDSPGAEQQLIELFQASIGSTTVAFAVLVKGIEELDPPSHLNAPHNEAVQAGLRVLAEYEERTDELGAIETLTGIDAYAEALSASGVRNRFTESCRELQAIADRENVAADLGCS